MTDFLTGTLRFRQFDGLASAHIEVAELCDKVKSGAGPSSTVRVLDIIPNGSGAFALIWVNEPELDPVFRGWGQAANSRSVAKVLFSLQDPSLVSNDNAAIWILESTDVGVGINILDALFACEGAAIDWIFRRSGAAGVTGFLTVPVEQEAMFQNKVGELKSALAQGQSILLKKIPVTGDYARFFRGR